MPRIAKTTVVSEDYDPLLAETPPIPGASFGGPPSRKGKKYPLRIKPQHRVAFHKHMVEKKPLKVALLEAGFSPRTANDPAVIIKSNSWQGLMDHYMPEDMVAGAHEKLFSATVEVIRHVPIGTDENGKTIHDTVYQEKVDVAAVKSALDMAYKLRGAYKEKEVPLQGANVYNLFYKPEVRESVRAFEDALKLQIINDSTKQSEDKDSASDNPIGNISHSGTLYDVGEPPQPTTPDEPAG